MIDKKDLFTLFRENQDKLNEVPPQQAWQKLERRLEAQRGRRRGRVIRLMTMAATLTALIAVITIFSTTVKEVPTANNMIEKSEMAFEMQTEDLVLNEANAPLATNRQMVNEYMKKFSNRQSMPVIEEGDDRKELTVRQQ